jgi:hypothetical protein
MLIVKKWKSGVLNVLGVHLGYFSMILHVTTISTSCRCGPMDYLGLLNFSVNGGYYGGYYVTDVKGHPLGARLLGIKYDLPIKRD